MATAFERQSDGSLKLLTLLGEFGGFDPTTNNPIYRPITITDVGQPPAVLTPLAPTILGTSNMPTSTTVRLNWSAPTNPDSRPDPTSYRVFRDGNQVTSTNATTFTYLDTVATATPNPTYSYTVAAVNSEGQGDLSAPLSVQWGTVLLVAPTAPTSFSRSSMTSTSVDLFWSETADSTVDKHGLYDGSTLVLDNIPASSTSYSWTGLASGRTFTSLKVKRHNAAGWSNASNALNTFSLANSTVQHDIVMGVPSNDQIGDLAINTWPAARVYLFGDVASTITQWGSRVIALTDKNTSNRGGQSSADSLQNFLENFYYTSTGTPKNTGIEIHWAVGNEIDNDAGMTSGPIPQGYTDTVAACSAAVHLLNANGTRRYPKASMWIDMTQHQMKPTVGNSGVRYQFLAQYLDGMACSMYPPGRDLSKNRPDAPVFSTYPSWVDNVMTAMDSWHTAYPNCNSFATWETGIPVDHANYVAGGTVNQSGAATSLTDLTIRPRYFAGGYDHHGTNWTGLLQYMYNALNGMGVKMREQIYWNQVSNPNIPNLLKYDKQPIVTPDTEHAWHNWTPGSRLPDAR